MIRQYDISNAWIQRFISLLSLILLIGLLQGCKPETSAPTLSSPANSPISVKTNDKHQIDVEFYGELLGADSEPQDHLVVDRILIRDKKSGKAEQFIPQDVESLQSSLGYFTKVWSPDGDYLALPLGRFQGFVLFDTTTVMEKLQRKDYSDTIQIGLTSNQTTKLWHEFIGWQAPHNFHFSAGLSGKQSEFIFNPKTGKAQSKDTETAGSFNAITKSGLSEVSIGMD